MENSKVDQHLDWLLRNHQIDLSGLERERLEQLTIGLLRGQVLVFEELGQETRQSQIIGAQQQLHHDLQAQMGLANQTIANLSTAVARLEETDDHYYKSTVLMLVDLVMRSWMTEGRQPAIEILFTGLWRAVEAALQNGDIDPESPVAQWWMQAARENFGFPMLGEEPEPEPEASTSAAPTVLEMETTSEETTDDASVEADGS